MIIETEKVDNYAKFGDLEVGATFYLLQEGNNFLYLKIQTNSGTHLNCINLTQYIPCLMGGNTPVIEVKTKVVPA